MACNAGYTWCAGETVVYRDEQGDEYCIFHAPKDKKRKSLKSEECYIVKEFNNLVFAEIDRASIGSEDCDLEGTIFPGNIFFLGYDDSRPLGNINFRCAEFNGKVEFWGTVFSGSVEFNGVKFRGTAIFTGATFKKDVEFWRAEFEADARFGATNFQGRTEFKEAVFHANADFRPTKVEPYTKTIKPTVFIRQPDFSEVAFKGYAYFGGKTFTVGADLSKLFLYEAKLVRFDGVHLSTSSFLDTDVRKIEFIGCDLDGRRLYDEIALDPKNDAKNKEGLGKVELLYRRLKQRSKEEHNEPMVSDWHTREKEMQRRATGKPRWGNICQWLFINFYGWLSGYGENYRRALGVLAFLIFLAIATTGYLGIKPKKADCGVPERTFFRAGVDSKSYVFCSPEFWSIPVYTLEDLSFQRGVEYEPATTTGRLFRLLFRVFAIIQFTLFALALRNRFRR